MCRFSKDNKMLFSPAQSSPIVSQVNGTIIADCRELLTQNSASRELFNKCSEWVSLMPYPPWSVVWSSMMKIYLTKVFKCQSIYIFFVLKFQRGKFLRTMMQTLIRDVQTVFSDKFLFYYNGSFLNNSRYSNKDL